MPPWSVMRYSADALARFLAAPDGGVSRYLLQIRGEEAGAVSVRFPWLKGPYLELLAILPAFQGQGIGSALLGWFEQEGIRLGARNLLGLCLVLQHRGASLLRPPWISPGGNAQRPRRRRL